MLFLPFLYAIYWSAKGDQWLQNAMSLSNHPIKIIPSNEMLALETPVTKPSTG